MKRRIAPILLTLAMSTAAMPVTVWAVPCPAPEAFVIPADALPATAAAVRKGALTIMALGGTATLGHPARGIEFTYPSRLAARLGEALPGVAVKVVMHAAARQSLDSLLLKLDAELAADKPVLVIWGPGASAAGRGEDLDTFAGHVSDTIAKIRSTGADVILMTLQYAPSVARLVNLYPYRVVVIRAGETAGLPVLDRYELMRFWSDNTILDLDAVEAADRLKVARKVYDCMAEILTKGIADAVR